MSIMVSRWPIWVVIGGSVIVGIAIFDNSNDSDPRSSTSSPAQSIGDVGDEALALGVPSNSNETAQSAIHELPPVDGPFGLKFGVNTSSQTADASTLACRLPTPVEGTHLADLEKVKTKLALRPTIRSAGPNEIEVCEIYLDGTLAFAFAPYDTAETIFSSLADEFNERYGIVEPRPFRTEVDYGIFQPNIQPISLGIYDWQAGELQIEFTEPRGIDFDSYLYSKDYAYLLYLDKRRINDLASLKSQVIEEEAARETADREARERQKQETLREF